jgi:hypothetical protein
MEGQFCTGTGLPAPSLHRNCRSTIGDETIAAIVREGDGQIARRLDVDMEIKEKATLQFNGTDLCRLGTRLVR